MCFIKFKVIKIYEGRKVNSTVDRDKYSALRSVCFIERIEPPVLMGLKTKASWRKVSTPAGSRTPQTQSVARCILIELSRLTFLHPIV
jgi:hypothetical protein